MQQHKLNYIIILSLHNIILYITCDPFECLYVLTIAWIFVYEYIRNIKNNYEYLLRKVILSGPRYFIIGTLKIAHVGLITFICRYFAIIHDCIENNVFGSNSKTFSNYHHFWILNLERDCIKLLARKKACIIVNKKMYFSLIFTKNVKGETNSCLHPV